MPSQKKKKTESKYESQNRGSTDGYSSYYNGMDKTMRQKVALSSSYFPTTGRIADMGCGSGKGSFDLASLYSKAEVVGVDISPESVKYCREQHKRPNLSFEIGDVAKKLFPDGHFDGILNSSVLHHVTSFNDFNLEKIFELFDNQTAMLSPGGILAVRDFVVPTGPKTVFLDLPNNDGSNIPPESEGEKKIPVADLSTAALFELFARNFKCAAHRSGGIPFEKTEGEAGRTRYKLGLRPATEFILRKDYRQDWDVELLEEYLYFSQEQFETESAKRGLRVLLSRPIYNPWIIANRWEGKIGLSDLNGRELPFPPTNYMFIAQKIPVDEG
ncbi:MAG: class I SAM-dependent methyltransferase, partial [Bdellovibrionia bacterium]